MKKKSAGTISRIGPPSVSKMSKTTSTATDRATAAKNDARSETRRIRSPATTMSPTMTPVSAANPTSCHVA